MLTSIQLRLLATKIVSSPGNRGRFRACAIKHYSGQFTDKNVEIAHLMVVRDIRLRWNSTQAMMGRALLLADVSLIYLPSTGVLTVMQAIDDFAFNSKKYRQLLLSRDDWASIKSLNSVLQVRPPSQLTV